MIFVFSLTAPFTLKDEYPWMGTFLSVPSLLSRNEAFSWTL